MWGERMVPSITKMSCCPPVAYHVTEKSGSTSSAMPVAFLMISWLYSRMRQPVLMNLRMKVREVTLASMESRDWCFSHTANLFMSSVKR
jgi:hypothetical protein